MSFVLAFALGAYVADCFAMAAPDEAMKCCDSTPCAPHSHDQPQDCCKAMPSTHGAFLKPSVRVFFSTAFIALLPMDHGGRAVEPFASGIPEHSHAPPAPHSVSISPLRI